MLRYSLLIGSLLAVSGGGTYWLRRFVPPVRTLLIMSGVMLGLTLLFDNYLTGLPIVLYNKSAYLGWLLWHIPLEDLGYLAAVLLLVPALFEYFARHSQP